MALFSYLLAGDGCFGVLCGISEKGSLYFFGLLLGLLLFQQQLFYNSVGTSSLLPREVMRCCWILFDASRKYITHGRWYVLRLCVLGILLLLFLLLLPKNDGHPVLCWATLWCMRGRVRIRGGIRISFLSLHRPAEGFVRAGPLGACRPAHDYTSQTNSRLAITIRPFFPLNPV